MVKDLETALKKRVPVLELEHIEIAKVVSIDLFRAQICCFHTMEYLLFSICDIIVGQKQYNGE